MANKPEKEYPKELNAVLAQIKKEFGDWDFKKYEEGNLFLILEAMKI